MALITSLVMMIVLTMLVLSMFRGTALFERLAGNTLEKQRAQRVAESALRHGEWWLSWYVSQTNPDMNAITTAAPTCSGPHVDGNLLANMRVCANPLVNPAGDLTWPGAADYTPTGQVVAPGGGLAAGGDVNYTQRAALYITYLAASSGPTQRTYLLHAVGYGGGSNTAAVVQSTFAITPNVAPAFGGGSY